VRRAGVALALAVLGMMGGRGEVLAGPWRFSWGKELALMAGGGAMAASGLHMRSLIDPVQRPAKDKGSIPFVDWTFVASYDRAWDAASDVSLALALVLPVSVAAAWEAGDAFHLLLLEAESAAWIAGLADWCKWATRRVRPYAYDPNCPPDLLRDPDSRASFFSEHVSQAFAAAEILRKWSKGRQLQWAPVVGYSLASVTLVARIRAGSHFLTDTLVGAGVGVLTAKVMLRLHEADERIEPLPTANGFSLQVAW